MKFILAKKMEMTQKFAPDGAVIPVTKVIAGPCVVVQIKTEKNDGYSAVQLGFGLKKSKNINKPQTGHLKKLGNFRYLREFRIPEAEAAKLALGSKITSQVFQSGDMVKVTGLSKGKGFQGVVRRRGFHGSPATHGHKDQLRMPGSIGAGGNQHVLKGRRMPGQMGDSQVTVLNLEVVEINPENNEIFVKGALPGARNNLLLLAGDGEIVIETEAPAMTAEKAEESMLNDDKKTLEHENIKTNH